MPSYYDRVYFTAAAGGTGAFVAATPVNGYRTPAGASVPNGVELTYVAESLDLSQWEVGLGSYVSASGSIARTTVRASSSGGGAVNFTAPPRVFVDMLAGETQALGVTSAPTFAGMTIEAAAPSTNYRAAAGPNAVTWQGWKGNNLRWAVRFPNGDAESAGDLGSNFNITRHHDDGSSAGLALTIYRYNGLLEHYGNITINTVTAAVLTVQSSTGFANARVTGAANQSALHDVNPGVGSAPGSFRGMRNSSLRWSMDMPSSVNDNFSLKRYNDSGVSQGEAFGIDRATGLVTFAANVLASLPPSADGHLTNKTYVDDALDLKAPLVSPEFTGSPTAPTPGVGNTTNVIATAAMVTAATSLSSLGLDNTSTPLFAGVNLGAADTTLTRDGVAGEVAVENKRLAKVENVVAKIGDSMTGTLTIVPQASTSGLTITGATKWAFQAIGIPDTTCGLINLLPSTSRSAYISHGENGVAFAKWATGCDAGAAAAYVWRTASVTGTVRLTLATDGTLTTTGPVVLPGAPTADNHAATRLYADGKQTADPTLSALALLDTSLGLVEQTGTDQFGKRAIGVAAGGSVPTRADADARYPQLATGNNFAASASNKFRRGGPAGTDYAAAINVFIDGAGTNYGMTFQASSDSNTNYLRFYNAANTVVGNIVISATATTYNTSCDAALKNDLREAEPVALPIIDAIKVYDFMWNADGTRGIGVTAQELYEIEPRAVSPGDAETPWSADYSKLVPHLIVYVQELQRRIAELERQVLPLSLPLSVT